MGVTAPVFFPEESNDLFTSGWSFGTFSTGQSQIYVVDGIQVPPEFVRDRIDNGAGDLALNLAEFLAVRSAVPPASPSNRRPPQLKKNPRLSQAEIAEKRALAATGIFDNEGADFQGPWQTINWSAINLLTPPQQTRASSERAGGHDGGSVSTGGDAIDGSKLGISEDCEKQAKALLGEEGWKKALELLRDPPLIDIESTPSQFNVSLPSLGEDLAVNYFGADFSRSGESVSSSFDRNREGQVLAVCGGGLDGIYYRSSERPNFSNANFLLHEVLHLLYPGNLAGRRGVDLDEELIEGLGIDQDPGMSNSEAVSRFFNSGCDPKYGGVIFVQ